MDLSIFPSHFKGEETRQKIINLVNANNGLSTKEIAQNINKSVIQTKRQLQKIHLNGGVFFHNGRWFITSKAYHLSLTSYWE